MASCAALSIAAEPLEPTSRTGVPLLSLPPGAHDGDELDVACLGRAVGLLAGPAYQILLAHRYTCAVHSQVQGWAWRCSLVGFRRLDYEFLVRGTVRSRWLGTVDDSVSNGITLKKVQKKA